MAPILHRVSAVCFYVLGLTFFLAYIGVRNDIAPQLSAIWLQAADLPLAISALTYGGISFYLSLTSEKGSKPLAWGIGIPVVIFFAILALLNFWKVLFGA